MKIRAAKAKGKRLCKESLEMILSIYPELKGHIYIPSACCPGEDLFLSAIARQKLPFAFEMKNCEKAKPWEWIEQAKTHSHDGRCPVVVFSRNHEKEPYAIISFRDLLGLIKK